MKTEKLPVRVRIRVFNQSTHLFEWHDGGRFKSYVAAVRHYNGEQDWWDKLYHRFVANNCLHEMFRD